MNTRWTGYVDPYAVPDRSVSDAEIHYMRELVDSIAAPEHSADWWDATFATLDVSANGTDPDTLHGDDDRQVDDHSWTTEDHPHDDVLVDHALIDLDDDLSVDQDRFADADGSDGTDGLPTTDGHEDPGLADAGET